VDRRLFIETALADGEECFSFVDQNAGLIAGQAADRRFHCLRGAA
jgi:hypothetical protein